jgi:CRP-like cAMP-binding protein
MFARNAHPGVQLLDGIELFGGCTQRELRAVAPLLCPVDVQPGSVLTREGDFANQFLVVVAGTARSTNAAGDSGFVGRGSVIGEQAVDRQARADVSIVASTRMTVLAATPAELRRIVELAPSVRFRLYPSEPLQPRHVRIATRAAERSRRRVYRMTSI